MIHQNILDAIGHTPIIQLKRMVPEGAARVLVKYEGLNVGGSIKTRVAYNMIQDAIAKGMKWREERKQHRWDVPYIPIDPQDISRTYDADVIRVNSQSGKGGIGYLLEQSYGYILPPKMREHFGYLCKNVSDHDHRELKGEDVLVVSGSRDNLMKFASWEE